MADRADPEPREIPRVARNAVTDSGKAVFLSYASQDAEVAHHLCSALRAAGVEVWFDQAELRGGDSWDASIRRQIKSCALFVPMISANTQSRTEGYFRREWNLAVARTLDMAEGRPFLLPVVTDRIRDSEALVPEKFREVQWTHLPAGADMEAFVEHVRRLLTPEAAATAARGAQTPAQMPSPISAETIGSSRSASRSTLPWILSGLLIVAVGYFLVDKLVPPKHPVPITGVPATVPPAFNPPPRSIAVLPFVNMSGDKEQEYFSDGLTEELLNSLAEISELQVAARTSAFSFKGKDTDIGTIARKLNVGTVLEGSVRRSAHTVRVTAQLINAVTGFHLWSKSYDRDLGDVLKLQTQIATAVADALKVTLLDNTAAKIELGGTREPAALDARLRALRSSDAGGGQNYLSALDQFTDAIRIDPGYALAYAGRSFTETLYASQVAARSEVGQYLERASADAERSIAIAPGLAEGHVALGFYLANGALDFGRAGEEFERARQLGPGSATILRITGLYAVMTGRRDAGVADLRRAVTLDPLNATTHHLLGFGLYLAHRYQEARTANSEAIRLDPGLVRAYEYSGLTDYQLGDLEAARTTCETKPEYWGTQWCLAVTYQKLGRHDDAQAALAKIQAILGDSAAYQYATIYVQWGDIPKALEWIEAAMRLRDPGLSLLKSDPLVDPMRTQPRYQVIEQKLKFPSP
jgi:TolB-like protein/lipoprotein NlpI